jgi:hexaprenyl-diphosphate synthase
MWRSAELAGNPALDEIIEYYVHHPSKHIRPLIFLLLPQATSGLDSQWDRKLSESRREGVGGMLDELVMLITRPHMLS